MLLASHYSFSAAHLFKTGAQMVSCFVVQYVGSAVGAIAENLIEENQAENTSE